MMLKDKMQMLETELYILGTEYQFEVRKVVNPQAPFYPEFHCIGKDCYTKVQFIQADEKETKEDIHKYWLAWRHKILADLGIEEPETMTPGEYQTLAARTINQNLTNYELEDHALKGMVGEVGEICSIYQKVYQGHPIAGEQEHLKKELGDLLWFVAEYCTAKGWDISEVMEMNIEKLKKRYPDGFETGKSMHREQGDI